MGLFDKFRKPKWKHEDSDVRIEGVKELDDQKILVEIAKTDESGSVREEAIKKITDESVLIDILKKDNSYFCKEEAVKKINDEKLLIDIVKNSSNEDTRASALTNIHNETFLKEIVDTDKSNYVRGHAVRCITDKQYLKEIAINEPYINGSSFAGNESVIRLVKLSGETMNMDDRKIFLDIINNAKSFSVRGEVVNHYKFLDETTLVNIVNNDGSDVVRSYAVKALDSRFETITLTNLKSLVKTAINYPYYHVRRDIIELINKHDKTLLKEIIDANYYDDGTALAKRLYES